MKSIKLKRNLVICSVFFVLGLAAHKVGFNDYDLPLNLSLLLGNYVIFGLIDKGNEILQRAKGE
jgi:hypothetical protein